MDLLGLAFEALVLLIGGTIGSFLNVVAHRLPEGRSVVRPASHCPGCGSPVRLRHNVPVLGWLLVRGRCADCDRPISIRYPFVELTMALLALGLLHVVAGGPVDRAALASPGFPSEVLVPWVLYLVPLSGMLAVALIDLDWFVIPDVLSLPGIPLGLLTSAVVGDVLGTSWRDAAIGAALGAGVLILVIVVYGWITGRQGMGGGDWKLLGALGAYLGWQALPFILLAGSLQGILVALVAGRAFAVEELPPEPGAEGAAEAEAPPDGAEGGSGLDAAGEAAAGEAEEGGGSLSRLAIPFGPFLALAGAEYLLLHEPIRALMEQHLLLGP